MRHYLTIDSKRYGPYSEEQVAQFISQGRVKGEDLVWDEDGNRWVKLEEFPLFQSSFVDKKKAGYILNIDGRVLGPLSLDELQDLAGKGKLSADDMVWNMTSNAWEKAKQISVLRDIFAKMPIAEKYFVSIRGEAKGPLSWEELEQLAARGEISPKTYFYDGSEWRLIKASAEMSKLFEQLRPPTPPDAEKPSIPAPPVEEFPPPATVVEPSSTPPTTEADILPPAVPPLDLAPEETEDIEGLEVGERTSESDLTPPITAVETAPPEEAVTEELEAEAEAKAKKPAWLSKEETHKIDVSGVKPSKAFLIPTAMIDEDTIDAKVGVYNQLTKLRRLYAIFVDALIIAGTFMVVLLVLSALNYHPFYPSETQYQDQILLASICGGIFLFYFLFRDGFTRNGSLGKKISGIYVSRKNGRSCGVLRSFIRNLFFLVPPLTLVDILIIFFSKNGRRIGDFIAGTIITNYEPEYQETL